MNAKLRFRLLPIYRGLLLLALVPNCYPLSQNFLIEPNGSLPTSVPPGGSVTANFTVTNLTHSARNGYEVQGLPGTVTQVTSGGGACGDPINLSALASCNLELSITGAVHSGFAICKGSSCTTSSVPLSVTVENNSNFSYLASGTYNDSDLAFFPLLVQNKNGTVTYPSTIITNLPTNPTYSMPYLFATSCNANICISVGDDNSNGINPLVAFSGTGGDTWTYPIGGVGSWPTDFNPGSAGIFSAASCTTNLCIAGGTYTDLNTAFPHPFIAQYKSGSWTYPITAQNPPPNFDIFGRFNNVSCMDSTCIAVGTYQNISSIAFPLIAETTDGGTTWNYVVDNTTTLPSNYANHGEFFGASCFDTICIAGGTYEDQSFAASFPLLAQSISGGPWTYVIDDATGPAFPAIPDPFSLTRFNTTSCSASICIAAGTYFYDLTTTTQYALLAQSTNTGSLWTYAISTTAQQPSDFSQNAQFTSSGCTDNFCVAVGFYTNIDSNQLPMIAQTTDGGSTWSYAIDGTHGPQLPDYTSSAQFNTASCLNGFCMAAGSYMVGQATYPMYAQSNNGGSQWTYIVTDNALTLPSNFNNFGVFSGSGISGSSLMNKIKKALFKK